MYQNHNKTMSNKQEANGSRGHPTLAKLTFYKAYSSRDNSQAVTQPDISELKGLGKQPQYMFNFRSIVLNSDVETFCHPLSTVLNMLNRSRVDVE